MTTETNDVTLEEFKAYERVRLRGNWNMLTHRYEAANEAGLDHDRYMAVMIYYEECMEKWPKVRGNV